MEAAFVGGRRWEWCAGGVARCYGWDRPRSVTESVGSVWRSWKGKGEGMAKWLVTASWEVEAVTAESAIAQVETAVALMVSGSDLNDSDAEPMDYDGWESGELDGTEKLSGDE